MLQSLIHFCLPDYEPQRWHITLIIYAIVLLEGLINTKAFQIVPWTNIIGSCLHVLLFIVFVAILLAIPRKRSMSFVFLDRTSSLGWSNDVVSWQIGILTATSGFVGKNFYCLSFGPNAQLMFVQGLRV